MYCRVLVVYGATTAGHQRLLAQSGVLTVEAHYGKAAPDERVHMPRNPFYQLFNLQQDPAVVSLSRRVFDGLHEAMDQVCRFYY